MRNRTSLTLLLCLFLFQQLEAKVRIIVPVFNRPDFIELQYKGLKKFLKDDFELMLFNDANRDEMRQEIEQVCGNLGIMCVRVPQELHNPDPKAPEGSASYRHGEVLQFAYNNFGVHHDDIVCTMDSDMFMIREFSIRDYLGDYDLNAYYGWAFTTHFLVLNIPKLKDPETISFRCRVSPDGDFKDVGHDGYVYIEAHKPELKVKQVDILWGIHRDLHIDRKTRVISQLLEKGYTMAEANLVKAIFDATNAAARQGIGSGDCDIGFYEGNIFLDYKHGSLWTNPNPMMEETKNRIVKQFLHTLLD
ncbi:MAG TPA: hypothetical protein VLE89_04260 [Chlamydiales bacterium]|nr:hypothetical protein [Chlamydiales bacterium]